MAPFEQFIVAFGFPGYAASWILEYYPWLELLLEYLGHFFQLIFLGTPLYPRMVRGFLGVATAI
jgi:hypothetical protein